MSPLWHALHVRAGFEQLVEAQLQRKGYEVLLPTYTPPPDPANRAKLVTLSLFRPYIFCRFNFAARLPVTMTPGVDGVLGEGRKPLAVDDGEISVIRHSLGSGLRIEPWPFPVEGDYVRITKGPLKGITGFHHANRSGDQLILSVTLLMRSIAVEIERSWIKPAKPIPTAKWSGPLKSEKFFSRPSTRPRVSG